MAFQLKPLQKKHQTEVVNILNYYIENSFSAYFAVRLPQESFDAFLQSCKGYPAYVVQDQSGKTIGFGLVKPFHPGEAIRRTGELSYFIDPGYTRQGLGELLLNKLIEEAQKMGIDTVVASVSSRNEPSLHFHRRNGFKEAGRLEQAGRKFEQDFDILLFQKNL